MPNIISKPTVLLICNDGEVIDDIHTAFSFCMPEVKIQAIIPGADIATSLHTFNPDMVILDFDNHLTGKKSIKNIKTLSNAVVITMSYLNDEQVAVKALAYGANDHIIKPIKSMEFIARVRSLLNVRQQLFENK